MPRPRWVMCSLHLNGWKQCLRPASTPLSPSTGVRAAALRSLSMPSTLYRGLRRLLVTGSPRAGSGCVSCSGPQSGEAAATSDFLCLRGRTPIASTMKLSLAARTRFPP